MASVIESPAVQIFAVSFNYFLKDRKVFATAAGNKISIYECLETQENDGQLIKLLRVYTEPDKDEVFNSISWSFDSRGPILGKENIFMLVNVLIVLVRSSNWWCKSSWKVDSLQWTANEML